MQANSISKIANKLIGFFKTIAKNVGDEVAFVKRKDKAKVNAETFVKMLTISALANDKASLEEICANFKQAGINISKQGVEQRFNASASTLMKNCFVQALNQFKAEQQPVIDLLKPFAGVEILDSSVIRLPSEVKDIFPGTGRKHSEAALKIQTIFNYVSGQVEEATVTDERKNDQGFREHLTRIKKRVLYLQDLGYFAIESFAIMHKEGAYFISRYLFQTHVFDREGEKIDLLKMLEKSGGFIAKKVWVGEKHKVPIRLIAKRLPKEVVEKRIRDLRKRAKKRGKEPSSERLALEKWSICITNVAEDVLKNEHIYLIYSLRWQIELFFKLCKQVAGINKISSKKIHRILCELYAKLICVVMLLSLCFEVRWNATQEISFVKAYKALRKYAMVFCNALNSIYKLKFFIKNFLPELVAFAMKDIKKKKPATHQKMMAAMNQVELG